MRDATKARGTGGAVADTIFAPATGPAAAAIAIIRISGPAAHQALCALTGAGLPGWRELTLSRLRAADGELIDEAMVVAFPEGASYTGEAMGEIHCHGSRAVVLDLLAELGRMPGCRLAEPGEFTHRAFLRGKMNLCEVEGLGDLIAAETREQRRQALRVHTGAISRKTDAWRDLLLRARSLLELTIDWVDEEIPEDVLPDVTRLLAILQREIRAELSGAEAAEKMRIGFEVAIVGPPNVGKSSLLNAIAGREAAIVTEVAGTTRDVIEVRFDLDGYPVKFLDTAGLRATSDPVERIGVQRAQSRAAAADLRILLSSADTTCESPSDLSRPGDLRVWTKSDLGPGSGDVSVSTISPKAHGVDELLGLIRDRLADRHEGLGLLAHARQCAALQEAFQHVQTCHDQLGVVSAEESAEDLRLASCALDRLVGRIDVEAVLGEIFGRFCLGK